jgi:hypothetical protein
MATETTSSVDVDVAALDLNLFNEGVTADDLRTLPVFWNPVRPYKLLGRHLLNRNRGVGKAAVDKKETTITEVGRSFSKPLENERTINWQ